MAVRGPHDGHVRSEAVEPDEPVHPVTLDCRLALRFQAHFDEERDSGREILDHNANVIHSVNRHHYLLSSAALVAARAPGIRRHPAAFSASICQSSFCDPVPTLA